MATVVKLTDANENFVVVYDQAVENFVSRLALRAEDPDAYKGIVARTLHKESVYSMIDENFDSADDDDDYETAQAKNIAAFREADAKQIVAFFKASSVKIYGNADDWVALPLFYYYSELFDEDFKRLLVRDYGLFIRNTYPQDMDTPTAIGYILASLSYPGAFKKTMAVVDRSEPMVTPQQSAQPSLVARVFEVAKTVASIPTKVATAIANVATGAPVATEAAAVVAAVVAPVEAVAEVAAPTPAFNPYTDDFAGTRGRGALPTADYTEVNPAARTLPTADYTEVASAPGNVISQAADALTAAVTGAPVAASGRTDYDRAKAKFYRAYKHQPNGRLADRGRKAKTVVTDVAKYVPKRNDFKGLDDRTGVGAFAPRGVKRG